MERKQTLTDKYQYWNITTKVPSAETQRNLSLWDQSSICRKFPTVHVNSSVQSLSHAQLFATPWTAACQFSLSITNSQNLLKLMFIESVMPSNHLILCCPLLILPSIFPNIRIFSNESVLCIRWPKYCSFIFSICPYK